MEVSDRDKEEIKRLLHLKTVDMIDKSSCHQLVNKYINEGGKWCLTCDGAVRLMFRILRNWAEERGI